MGLLDLPGADPGSLYGQGLLTPEQKQAIAFHGLLGAAGAFGQAAMPSRMPVPIGAVLGSGAAGMGQAEDQAGQQALQGGLLGAQLQQMRWKMDLANKLPGLIAQMYGGGGAPGQGMPGMTAPSPQGGPPTPSVASLPPGLPNAQPFSAAGAGGASPVMSAGSLQNALWHIESGGSLNPPDSKTGAIGPMQIEPGTGAQYGATPQMLRDPQTNLAVGGRIINDLSQRYRGDPDAVAVAYNAGPGVADKWLSSGRNDSVLPNETQGYLNKLHLIMPQSAATGGAVPQVPGAPNFNMGSAAGIAALGDLIGVPSLGQTLINSPQWQAATAGAKAGATLPYTEEQKRYETNLQMQSAGPIAGAKAAANYPFQSALQQNKPYDLRPGGSHTNPTTGETSYGPQLIQVANPDGSKSFVYATPKGVQPTGMSAGISPQTQAFGKATGTNQANLGSYMNGPPGQVGTAAVAGGQPGPDALKFQTQPYKTPQGTLIPPLSAEYRPTDPKAIEAAIPDWQKAQGEMVESIEPSMQAKQRLQTFADMMKDVQSGSFMSHKAQWASDLRALGLGPIANAILSAKDAADVQTAIHENYQSALATLKSSTNRFTQKEFQTISENQVSPDLQPAANQQILSENMAFLNRQIQMAQDWNTAARGGWKNPDSFETEWNRANPMPKSVAQAGQEIGTLKGATSNQPRSATPAAVAKPAEAPEGTVVHMKDGSLRIKLNGQWNNIPASSFATAPIPPK